MSYIVGLTSLSGMVIWVLSASLRDFSSVQRIKEYTDYNKHEKDWEKPEPANKLWPLSGKIEAKNVRMRYREGLPLVLNGLTFSIKSCEKVGVVGRTGSGKSSLLLSILRIVEIETNTNEEGVLNPEGFIEIDGQRISDLGLHFVRKSLVIIPQDPFLFQGTLMRNVDPLGEFTKEEIGTALRTVRF